MEHLYLSLEKNCFRSLIEFSRKTLLNNGFKVASSCYSEGMQLKNLLRLLDELGAMVIARL